MATSEIHVGDIGTLIKTTLQDDGEVVDISGASDELYLVLKPDGTTTTWTAEFFDDGADGVIQYATQSGDLDQAGIWHIQAQVEWPTGEVVTAERRRLLVHAKIS